MLPPKSLIPGEGYLETLEVRPAGLYKHFLDVRKVEVRSAGPYKDFLDVRKEVVRSAVR